MSNVLHELQKLVESQTTVRTSRLKPLLQQLADDIASGAFASGNVSTEEIAKLQADVDRKEEVILRLQGEVSQHTLVRERHKSAMQDYENLKRNHKRLKDEYQLLIGKRAKEKDSIKKVQREVTDLQVQLSYAHKKLKKAGVLF